MSLVAIGLFVLACGWNVYRLFLPTRATALRNEGHPQYFGAALAAGYVALLAIFLNAALANFKWYSAAVDEIVKLAPQADKAEGAGPQSSLSKAIASSRITVIGKAAVPRFEGTSAKSSPSKVSASKTKSPPPPDPYRTVIAVGLWSAVLALIGP